MLYLSVGDLLLMITVHNCLEVHSPSFLMGAPMGGAGPTPLWGKRGGVRSSSKEGASSMVSVKVS